VQSKLMDVANAPGQEVSDVCEALRLVREGTEINYQGASGTVEFNEQGDVVGAYDVWTINDSGELEVVSVINVGAEE
jgi:neutral amino acid transport system substrate-binding protein